MRHDDSIRKKAAEMFDRGYGFESTASKLGLPRKTVNKWLYTYRALGKEVFPLV